MIDHHDHDHDHHHPPPPPLIIIILIRPFLCDRPSRRDCAPFSCSQSGAHPERQLSSREWEYDGDIAMYKKHIKTWIWGSHHHQGFLSI